MKLSLHDILYTPLPHQSFLYQLLMRSLMLLFWSRIRHIEGLEHIKHVQRPFILAANHTCYAEAVILPLLTMFLCGGMRVHFMADWSFLLNPFVRPFFKAGQIIPVLDKPARPKFLNRFKHRVVGPKNGWALASSYLEEQRSVGVFPEGVAHGNIHQLRPFRTGTARLAAKHKVPLLPVGIRFPNAQHNRIGIWPKMSFHFGEAYFPKTALHIHEINQQLVEKIAQLSQKQPATRLHPIHNTNAKAA